MGAVRIRWARIDHVSPEVGWLSPPEQDRLAALRHDADRRRFVGARMLLRQVIPDEFVLRQVCARCGGPHGRPVVQRGGRARIEVSMAHAGDLALVAVGRSPVGVDLEPQGGGDLVRWVRVEALLKATGHGLDVDPRLVDVGAADAPPRLRRWLGPGRRPAVRLADVDLAPGYVAAVARLGQWPLRIDVREVILP